MTGEAEPGATDSSTVNAGVSSHRVVSRNARLPSGSLVLSQVLHSLLSDHQLLSQHAAPSTAVSRRGLPARSVYAQSFHVSLADILITQPVSADRS